MMDQHFYNVVSGLLSQMENQLMNMVAKCTQIIVPYSKREGLEEAREAGAHVL